MQQNDAIQQQQLMSGAIQGGASPFGGDRAGVAAAALAGQQDLANNQTIAGLENQGYTQALGEANTQQQTGLSAQEASQYLGQQGAFGLTNLGTTAQSTALSGASAQLQSGGLQQQLAQEQLNVPYEQYLQTQAYPYQNLSALEQAAGIAGGLSGGTSSTTSPGASTASQVGGLGLAGLALNQALPEGYGIMSGLSSLAGLFKKGGIVPHYDDGGVTLPNVPDLSTSYVNMGGNGSNQIQMPHSSIPAAPKGESSSTSDANNPMGLGNVAQTLGGVNGLKSLFASGAGNNPLGLSAGSYFNSSDLSALANDFSNADTLFSASFKKGGIAHYDDGGMVGGVAPPAPSSNPLGNNNISQKLSQMTPQQLQQMQMKLPPGSPYGQIIQKTLQQKRMMPNVGQGIAAGAPSGAPAPSIQPQMAKGGIAPQQRDDSHEDDGMTGYETKPENKAKYQNVMSKDDSHEDDGVPHYDDGGAGPSDMSDPYDIESQKDMPVQVDHSGDTVKVKSNEGTLDLGIPSQKDNFNTALLSAGLAMMAGTSPHALVNVGKGGLEGVQTYDTLQQKAIEEKKAQQQLQQTGQYQTGELGLRQQQLEQTKAYQQAELGLRQQELKQWNMDPSTGMLFNKNTGELKNPYQGKATPSTDASGNPTSTTPEDYFGQMSPSQILDYRNTVKKNQPKDLQNQQVALTSLVDQNVKVGDLVNQIPIAASGDLHTLEEFADRNKIPVFSDPERGAASVSAAYDSLGNVLDNLKSTFSGTGRVLKSEFDTMKQELNAAANMSPEQKAVVVGKIQARLKQVTQDQLQYTNDVSSGMAYLPSSVYKSPSQKRLESAVNSQGQAPASVPAQGGVIPASQYFQ